MKVGQEVTGIELVGCIVEVDAKGRRGIFKETATVVEYSSSKIRFPYKVQVGSGVQVWVKRSEINTEPIKLIEALAEKMKI